METFRFGASARNHEPIEVSVLALRGDLVGTVVADLSIDNFALNLSSLTDVEISDGTPRFDYYMMINGIVIGVGLYARAIPYTSPRLLPRK